VKKITTNAVEGGCLQDDPHSCTGGSGCQLKNCYLQVDLKTFFSLGSCQACRILNWKQTSSSDRTERQSNLQNCGRHLDCYWGR